jgi:O-antigen ligase
MTRKGWAAVAALAAYVAWSYLSITWAAAPEVAMAGSHRALLYLGCFTLFVALPGCWRLGRRAVDVFILGVAIAGVVTALRLVTGSHLENMFAGPLLSAPIGYHNASAALWTMAALPALLGASRSELPAPLRGLLLGTSALLMHLAVLSQSRGWLFTLPVIVSVMAVLSPNRFRLALGAAGVALATVVVLPQLLAVFGRGGGGDPLAVGPDLAIQAMHAARSSLAASLVLACIGTAAAWADRRFLPAPTATIAPTTRLRARPWMAVVCVVALLSGIVGAASRVVIDDPAGLLGRAWARFQDFRPEAARGETNRFTAVGTGRYDIWRVSLEVVAEHPVGGLGQDNFAASYQQGRRNLFETQRWTHSLWLRLLVHTGVVGLVLFALFLVTALVAAGHRLRASTRRERALVAAALVPLTVWLVQGSIDWFWELPALSLPAFAGLGLAVAMGRDRWLAQRANCGAGAPLHDSQAPQTMAGSGGRLSGATATSATSRPAPRKAPVPLASQCFPAWWRPR